MLALSGLGWRRRVSGHLSGDMGRVGEKTEETGGGMPGAFQFLGSGFLIRSAKTAIIGLKVTLCSLCGHLQGCSDRGTRTHKTPLWLKLYSFHDLCLDGGTTCRIEQQCSWA